MNRLPLKRIFEGTYLETRTAASEWLREVQASLSRTGDTEPRYFSTEQISERELLAVIR